jgi:hypothetical protein
MRTNGTPSDHDFNPTQSLIISTPIRKNYASATSFAAYPHHEMAVPKKLLRSATHHHHGQYRNVRGAAALCTIFSHEFNLLAMDHTHGLRISQQPASTPAHFPQI